jgi:hypothetical protein
MVLGVNSLLLTVTFVCCDNAIGVKMLIEKTESIKSMSNKEL